MTLKTLTFAAVSAIALGAPAYADPPGSRGDLPPGLAKQGKIPPGHAKKIWGKGEYIPVEYRDYQFSDWRRYDLRDAPPGHRWVLVEDDVYLVDVASGLIAEALVDLLID